jgi:hypothetical protein
MANATTSSPQGTVPRPSPAPIAIPGTLIVKWISGRNGDFAVGDLHTPIGEFRVKDALLDQFDAGEYHGIFWISQIYSKSYEYRGRITIETRANLADLQIESESDADEVPEAPSELDPADEAPPAPPPAATPQVPLAPADEPEQVTTVTDEDERLFGTELCDLIVEGRSLKLDPTVDRLRLRQQAARLGDLGYEFDAKSQTWHAVEAAH